MGIKISSNIRVLMAEKDWTQKELADRTGLTTRYISDLVNNKNAYYPRESMEKLMEVFELEDASRLFKYNKE